MKKSYLYLLALLFSACLPQSRMTVTNVNDVSSLGNSSCLYALPLSGFAVTVSACHESFIPGPYCMYAAKYLGITDVMTKPYEKWSLSDVQISPYEEADPDFIFAVSSSRSARLSDWLQELSYDSLILLPGSFAARRVFDNSREIFSGSLSYTDLSVKRNFEAGKGIVISETLPDSVRAKLPVSKVTHEPVIKTTEQKAEEAANFIIKIRKRRFKLISGQYDFIPDGEALGRAVDELNHLEEEYISLFTGMKSISNHTKTIHFIPESNHESSRIILLRFSETEGFVSSDEADGKPLLADIRDMNKTKGLDDLIMDPDKTRSYLLYRVPDQAVITISFGEEIMLEAVFPVNQFGSLVTAALPEKK